MISSYPVTEKDRKIESRLFYLTAPDRTLSNRDSIHQGERGGKRKVYMLSEVSQLFTSLSNCPPRTICSKNGFLVCQQNVLPTWTLLMFTDADLAGCTWRFLQWTHHTLLYWEAAVTNVWGMGDKWCYLICGKLNSWANQNFAVPVLLHLPFKCC